MNPKLLIVDDEPQIRSLLNEFLGETFNIDTATNGKEAVDKAKHSKPDLILMDIMMPEMDGVTACKQLRDSEYTRHIPILLLTAANTTSERMRAFDLGADDFISKPFEVDELMSRLKSKLKRAQELRSVTSEEMTIGNMVMNDRKMEVTIDGVIADLSPVEYGILKLLMNRVEEIVSRNDIMRAVWEDETKSNRLIDAHITSLRKKLQNFSGDFQTIYGSGYRLKKEKAHA